MNILTLAFGFFTALPPAVDQNQTKKNLFEKRVKQQSEFTTTTLQQQQQ